MSAMMKASNGKLKARRKESEREESGYRNRNWKFVEVNDGQPLIGLENCSVSDK